MCKARLDQIITSKLNKCCRPFFHPAFLPASDTDFPPRKFVLYEDEGWRTSLRSTNRRRRPTCCRSRPSDMIWRSLFGEPLQSRSGKGKSLEERWKTNLKINIECCIKGKSNTFRIEKGKMFEEQRKKKYFFVHITDT